MVNEHPIRLLCRLTGRPESRFAEKAGIDSSSLSLLLNYKREPGGFMLLKLAKVSGIPPEQLLKPEHQAELSKVAGGFR